MSEDSYLDASYEDRTDDSHIGNDVSEFDGEPEPEREEREELDEPWDGFRSDAEADADVLASAGFGCDEDYGGGCEHL